MADDRARTVGRRATSQENVKARYNSPGLLRTLTRFRTLAPFALFALPLGCASDEEKAVRLLEEMAEISEKNSSDCDVLAKKLATFRKENKSRFALLRDSDRLKGQSKKRFEQEYQARIGKAMDRMVDATTTCRNDPKIAEAMAIE
jgi:hypothetical protein